MMNPYGIKIKSNRISRVNLDILWCPTRIKVIKPNLIRENRTTKLSLISQNKNSKLNGVLKITKRSKVLDTEIGVFRTTIRLKAQDLEIGVKWMRDRQNKLNGEKLQVCFELSFEKWKIEFIYNISITQKFNKMTSKVIDHA